MASMERLEKFNNIVRKMEPKQAALFEAYFVGALSVYVNDQDWEKCLMSSVALHIIGAKVAV